MMRSLLRAVGAFARFVAGLVVCCALLAATRLLLLVLIRR